MFVNENQKNVSNVLGDAFCMAYKKFKALILRIFALLKNQEKHRDLKEEFYESYVDFARKLKFQGYDDECYCYMDICAMYYNLMDRTDELIAHESFFMDLFDAFDEILNVRISESEDYDEKFRQFLFYSGRMQEYYYNEVAIPSPYFDGKSLNELTSSLSGDLK